MKNEREVNQIFPLQQGRVREGACHFPNRISNLVELGKKFCLPRPEKARLLPLPTGEGRGEGAVKAAFTLAEVLITLGIIGIVAAMTMPSCIGKYKRSVAETKLKKFYSVINQSINRSIAEKGEIILDTSGISDDKNAEFLENWCQENVTKYIVKLKTEGIEKNPNYYKVVFMDGSGVAIYLNSTAMYFFYQLDFDKPSITTTNMDGANEFLFTYNKVTKRVEPIFRNFTTSALKESCYKSGNAQRHGCAALIQRNGWKVPDDYPWIK